jgi:hypothetical protein
MSIFALNSFYGSGVALVVAFCLYLLYTTIFSPLAHIQGPILARFSRIWLLKEAYYSTFPFTNIKLHKRYGIGSGRPVPM